MLTTARMERKILPSAQSSLPDVAEILLKVLQLFGDLLPDVAEATARNPCVWARVVHPWQRRDLVLHFHPGLQHLLPHSVPSQRKSGLGLFQVLKLGRPG